MDFELYPGTCAATVADILRFHAGVLAFRHDFAVKTGSAQSFMNAAPQFSIATADLQGQCVSFETMNGNHLLARLDQRQRPLLVKPMRGEVQGAIALFLRPLNA